LRVRVYYVRTMKVKRGPPAGAAANMARSAGADFFASMDHAADLAPQSPDDTPRDETPARAATPPVQPRAPTPVRNAPTAEDSGLGSSPARTTPATPMTQVMKTTEFDEPLDGAVQRLLDTPRTREAFQRSGLRKEELQVKSYQDFYVPGDLPEKQRLRFNHYETRRQEKLNMVLQERAKVIAEKVRGNQTGDTLNYQSLQLMEGLLDTESKRLEKSLRAQLRYHAAVERENGSQLEKEKGLQSRLVYRQERKVVARTQYDAKSKQLKEICDAKQKHSQELQEKLEQQGELEQAKHIAMLLDEEVRLKEFEQQKAVTSSEKSEKWKLKCVEMRQRKEQEDIKGELRGQVILEKLNVKLAKIEVMQAEEVRKTKIKHEEESLKLIDAKDKIQRLERKDLFRRDLIRDHMIQQEERVDTLLQLRDQIVQQRKVRIKQGAVVKGRAMDIKGVTPGPGHYQPLPSCLNDMPVPKISSSKPLNLMKGSIDMMVKHSKTVPPCGTYDPKMLPSGNHLAWDVIDGCKTRIAKGTMVQKNFIDDNITIYKHNPGPGTYEGPSGCKLRHSVRIQREYVSSAGKPPPWCNPIKDTPAPDEYTVDKFTKVGRFKHSESAPALGKALAMSCG